MQVICLPVLHDNYIFVLHDLETHQAAVVDPAIAPPVLDCLHQLGADLVAILNTHHHNDHVGGNRQLLQQFPKACVYGGAQDQGRIPSQQVFLEDGDSVTFSRYQAKVLFVPGHTRAHIAYYFRPQQPDQPGDLFCGDTLFAGGCGRLFEGTPRQMMDSLSKLRNLPDSTRVWCAHEYTLKNLEFALTVEGDNSVLRQRYQEIQQLRDRNLPTIPSRLGVEKQTNPFLRWELPSLQQATHTQDPIQTFSQLRGMRNHF